MNGREIGKTAEAERGTYRKRTPLDVEEWTAGGMPQEKADGSEIARLSLFEDHDAMDCAARRKGSGLEEVK